MLTIETAGMALVKSLPESRSAFLGTGIEPNSWMRNPDQGRAESAHPVTRDQADRRPFLWYVYMLRRGRN
jgi:hypothetical protein